jgi:cation diffusion facilitator CzcD-associated flavoprotein CzcO
MFIPDHDIVILGAGLGGLGMASRLKAGGHTRFVVLEQADSLGGTWRDNLYPGAACDTESHLYSYSFVPHPDVSRLYARQPELLSYAARIVEQAGLEPHIRYNHRIVSANWDDRALLWHLALADGGSVSTRVFIPAWGQLNRPAMPLIPGRDEFKGTAFHSARWPGNIDLTGKRVASIGNAASAIQYIPPIAEVAAHLTVFQRSPNWIVPRGDRAYTSDELALYTSDPDAFRASRAKLFTWRETTFQRMLDGSDDALELEMLAREHAEAQVADVTLRAKLIPDFPLGCKRVLRSDDYFPALSRDNVTLETSAIERLTSDGIVTADGVLHPVDIVIFGTGFETQTFQGPVEVSGINDVNLHETWAAGAHAYLGMTVPHFPNFFLIYGPNTNLGHNSILSMLEAQFDYICQAINLLMADSDMAIDIKDQVMRAYDTHIQSSMRGTAWSGNCTSWYKNAAGRIINNWSGTVGEYQQLTSRFDIDVYRVLTRISA